MYSLSQLEKQQIGLRLPRYLVEQMDELAADHKISRTDIIAEAARAYISEQQAERFYGEFAEAAETMAAIATGQRKDHAGGLDELINGLADTHA